MSGGQSQTDVVPFEKDAIRAYLDFAIRRWRKSKSGYAKCYIDAFQSVRVSIFGTTLPVEDHLR